MPPANLLSLASIILACFLCGFADGQISLRGPLQFNLKRQATDRYINKKGDVCSPQFELLGGTFKVGPATYSTIYVCENGYLMPDVLETEGGPRQWENGNEFTDATSTMIAVALLNITRIDNWFDNGCGNVADRAWYIFEPVCIAQSTGLTSSVETGYSAFLGAYIYEFEPIAGPGATRAYIINDFINGDANVKTYYQLLDNPLAVGTEFRYSIFSHITDETFEAGAVNNVISRALLTSEFSAVIALTDPNLNPDWGFCVSWYKVAQPPEIVDRQNTFQIVMACRRHDSELGTTGKCYTIFDYFELMFVENDGVFMRAGVAGPNIRKKYL